MADDKKDLKPEEQTKNDPAASEQQTPGKDTPPAKEAVDSPGPAQEKTDPADKGRSGNVIDLSGAMIDKIVAEKEKAEKAAKAAKAAEAGKGKPAEPAQSGQKKKKAERSTPPAKKTPEKTGKPPAAKKDAPKKDAPAAEGSGLEEQKAKLEQELRKKYGIAKTDKPVEPFVIPETEQTVRIPHEQLHSFKNHPFNVEKNAKFMAFVASIRAQGVTQPAIVRPDEKGGYEIISGHRRDAGSIEAEIPYTPCIVRPLTDEQAIQQMVEDNVNNRDISTMELAKALKMQLEAIKHQGAKEATSGQLDPKDAGRRSNEIVAERNKMTVKQVQRYIKLNDLVPDLQKMMDAGQIKFTPAVELAYIKPKNQRYIAVAIEGQQSAPSLSQAQRMRELDQKGVLNGDVIDGIMMEDKKEVDKVILTGEELGKYFGKETTPRKMKDQIIKLLDDWKGQQKEVAKPEKKAAQQEK